MPQTRGSVRATRERIVKKQGRSGEIPPLRPFSELNLTPGSAADECSDGSEGKAKQSEANLHGDLPFDTASTESPRARRRAEYIRATIPRQKSTHVDSPGAVGERLKRARVGAGMSQRQLAFPGCSPAYISRVESGDRIPSLQILRELGRRLDVSEDYLAVGREREGASREELHEAEVLLRLDEPDEAKRLYDETLARAGSSSERADALAGLGQLAFQQGDPRAAIDQLEEALGLYEAEEANHPAAADTLGRAYAMVGELESAIALFERCLGQVEGRGDQLEILRFSVLLGYALIDAGNFGRAEELLGHALAIGKDFTDPIIRARLYWSQSRLHAERSDSDTAARYARRALSILELTENTHYTARAHQLLAHIELDRGHAEEALRIVQEGWPLLEGTGNAVERAQYRLEEARALAKLGRREEAAALAMQISGLIATAHPEDAARSYSVLAGVFEDLGDTSRARELYELAADMLQEHNPSRYLAYVYTRLAELAEADGRKDVAFEYLKKAVGMQQEIGQRDRV
jgi:tetratricopeptide (TPR) repeat protein